jgi:hypothetical protein
MRIFSALFHEGSCRVKFIAYGAIAVLLAGLLPARAGDPMVSSFDNGMLTWTNPASALDMYSVEWTHNLLSGAWQSDWEDQAAIVTTQGVVSVPVPVFYRVAEGFDNRALAACGSSTTTARRT